MKEEATNNILIKHVTVTSADTDMQGRIRLGALVNFLIQAAIDSAEVLGFGFGNLKTQQLFWVLSRMSLQIERSLHWNEKVSVETWPKTVDGILYIRDFIVRDKQNDIVARATSAWLAIDSTSKRPKLVGAEHAAIFNALKDKHAITDAPRKLGKIDLGEQFDYTATFFDIDLNKHVTSTRYIDWMLDTFTLDKVLNSYPSQLHINYQKETMHGETIALYRLQANENIFQFKGINQTNNLSAYQAELVF